MMGVQSMDKLPVLQNASTITESMSEIMLIFEK